jgi:hypothetical protein
MIVLDRQSGLTTAMNPVIGDRLHVRTNLADDNRTIGKEPAQHFAASVHSNGSKR